METFFLLIIILLLGIAVFDLVVGVSNDAVNFLTSAVGSKAGTLKSIMIVASAGILIGATSSGGMMEIARKGIFNPAFFSFQDVIFIYVVVMLSDIFLLDFFNSLRLPTSTTISIVFELLGASLAISFLKVYSQDRAISEWLEYINTSKALEMIIAIFLSVAVAFLVGWVVQYILRAAVTFDYKRYMKIGGSIFGGISVFVVLNFIINVGFKSSPLKDSFVISFLSENALALFLMSFIPAAAFFYLKALKKDFDTFKVVTFIGTFALAMAFASNDLVNFIGVPLAGFEAYTYWSGAAAIAPQDYTMEVFSEPASRSSFTPVFLLLSGIIMIATLWYSKKARNVIQTTVNLSRQAEGVERFSGNELARGVVRFVAFLSSLVTRLIPDSITAAIHRRYAINKPIVKDDTESEPAFDMVRASVNLIVAASLISLGTSLKLPLSTTYVSFMVIMGTSLADRAWNRDSAVYRVSGVFTVIGGWFITAISALTLSGILAIIVFNFEFVGILIVIILIASGIYFVNRFTDNTLQPEVTVELPDEWFDMPISKVRDPLFEKLKLLNERLTIYVEELIRAIIEEDGKAVREIERRLKKQNEINTYYQATITQQLKDLNASNLQTGRLLMDFYVKENELLRELNVALDIAKLHVLNFHNSLDESQAKYLLDFAHLISRYNQKMKECNGDCRVELEQVLDRVNSHTNEAVDHQVIGLSENRYSFKNSQIFLTTLLNHLNVGNILHEMYIMSALQERKVWNGM